MGDRFERLWPSLVALAGTVAIVLALLWRFDGNVEDSTPEGATAAPDAGAEAGAEPSPAPPTAGPTANEGEAETPPPTAEPTPAGPVTAPPELREPVGVVNQTAIAGLAQQVANRLEEGGWEVPAVGDFTGDVPETTVYYPDGMEDSAVALTQQFPEIGRAQPSFEGINQTRLVVVLVEDYVEETQ